MEVQIIRSRRRTLSLQVRSRELLLVRAPLFTSDRAIRKFVESNTAWIQKQLDRLALREEQTSKANPLDDAERKKLIQEAKKYFQEKTAYYAELLGVSYGRISIRHQKSKWGSCSAAGNLNFNALLMLAPESVRDYVIVHELCHRLHMNHSPQFWSEVRRICPDYGRQKAWLKEHEEELMLRNWAV